MTIIIIIVTCISFIEQSHEIIVSVSLFIISFFHITITLLILANNARATQTRLRIIRFLPDNASSICNLST